MSKQIIIQTANASENIRLSRIATRRSNLEEDLKHWRLLSDFSMSLDDMLKIPTGKTIRDRIIRYESYGYNANSGVTSHMIARLATDLLNSPEGVQLQLCRDPSRQSIDEEVQLATLSKYLPNARLEKMSNGKLTLSEGEFVERCASKKSGARSIDFRLIYGENEFYLFAKYAAGCGSAQTHQVTEGVVWLEEAKKYCNKHKHDNKKFFIMLADGEEAESHLKKINDELAGYSNIFAGNCEQVITFVGKSTNLLKII